MGAPAGNNFAKGNKGGGIVTADRLKVATFKGFVLDEMIAVMRGTDARKKWELILKMGPHCIPRDVDVTSGGKPLVMPAELIAKHGINSVTSADSEGHA